MPTLIVYIKCYLSVKMAFKIHFVYFVIFVCLPHTLLPLEKKSDVKHRNVLSWPYMKHCFKVRGKRVLVIRSSIIILNYNLLMKSTHRFFYLKKILTEKECCTQTYNLFVCFVLQN